MCALKVRTTLIQEFKLLGKHGDISCLEDFETLRMSDRLLLQGLRLHFGHLTIGVDGSQSTRKVAILTIIFRDVVYPAHKSMD